MLSSELFTNRGNDSLPSPPIRGPHSSHRPASLTLVIPPRIYYPHFNRDKNGLCAFVRITSRDQRVTNRHPRGPPLLVNTKSKTQPQSAFPILHLVQTTSERCRRSGSYRSGGGAIGDLAEMIRTSGARACVPIRRIHQTLKQEGENPRKVPSIRTSPDRPSEYSLGP